MVQPNLVWNVVIEELKYVEPVATFWSRCQPKQELRFQTGQDLLIRRRADPVSLVDNDIVKGVWLNQLQHYILRQGLNCRENILSIALLRNTSQLAKLV